MEHEDFGDTSNGWCTQKNTNRLVKGLEAVEIRGQLETIQTTALLRSARILRRVQTT